MYSVHNITYVNGRTSTSKLCSLALRRTLLPRAARLSLLLFTGITITTALIHTQRSYFNIQDTARLIQNSHTYPWLLFKRTLLLNEMLLLFTFLAAHGTRWTFVFWQWHRQYSLILWRPCTSASPFSVKRFDYHLSAILKRTSTSG